MRSRLLTKLVGLLVIVAISSVGCRDLAGTALELPIGDPELRLTLLGPEGAPLGGAVVQVTNGSYADTESDIVKFFVGSDGNGGVSGVDLRREGYFDVDIWEPGRGDLTPHRILGLHTDDLPWVETYEAEPVQWTLSEPAGFPAIDWSDERVDFMALRSRSRVDGEYPSYSDQWSPSLSQSGAVLQLLPIGDWRSRLTINDWGAIDYCRIELAETSDLATVPPDWGLVPVWLEFTGRDSAVADSVLLRLGRLDGCEPSRGPIVGLIDRFQLNLEVALGSAPIRGWLPAEGAKFDLVSNRSSEIGFLAEFDNCLISPVADSTVQLHFSASRLEVQVDGVTDYSLFKLIINSSSNLTASARPLNETGQYILYTDPASLWLRIEDEAGSIVHEQIVNVVDDLTLRIDLSSP